MPDPRVALAWAGALAALLLLAASLTGEGGGFGGSPWLRHIGWSYAALAVALLAVVLHALRAPRTG